MDHKLEYKQSHVLPSTMHIPGILRVSQFNKQLLWRPYHRIVDVLRMWFDNHGVLHWMRLPHGGSMLEHAQVAVETFVNLLRPNTILEMSSLEQQLSFGTMAFVFRLDRQMIDCFTSSWLLEAFASYPSLVLDTSVWKENDFARYHLVSKTICEGVAQWLHVDIEAWDKTLSTHYQSNFVLMDLVIQLIELKKKESQKDECARNVLSSV